MRLSQISIRVKDFEKSLHFYRDILGLSLDWTFYTPSARAFLSCGTIRIILYESSSMEPASSWFTFELSGLREAVAEMKAKGAIFEPESDSSDTFPAVYLRDPDGNYIGLVEANPTRPASPLLGN